jgi:hypothetical protein
VIGNKRPASGVLTQVVVVVSRSVSGTIYAAGKHLQGRAAHRPPEALQRETADLRLPNAKRTNRRRSLGGGSVRSGSNRPNLRHRRVGLPSAMMVVVRIPTPRRSQRIRS